VYFDPMFDERVRRERLFDGDLIVNTPTAASHALCNFARDQIAQSFPGLDPETAQYQMPVEKYAAILAELKPRFMHHPQTLALVRDVLHSLGYPEDTTYFDVPRLRSSTSDGYLTTGIAYAFHAHRDTWYSAPMCQVNLWMPVYATRPDNIMAFHPNYWSEPALNDSHNYDYQNWNATSRFSAAKHIGKDTRVQPRAQVSLDLEPDIRLVAPVGGIKQFSAAQLHSSIPNRSGKTRFSIDFRVVNLDDLENDAGAPNIDSCCTGTALVDFRRLSDLQHLDRALIDRYMPGHPQAPRTTLRALA